MLHAMKITDTNQVQNVKSPRRRSGVASTADGTFDTLLESVQDSSNSPPPLLSGVASMDILLMAQMDAEIAPSPSERDTKPAHDLLSELEKLRLEMLDGAVPTHRLTAIRDRMNSIKKHVFDPDLRQIMDHIILRAEVELARLEH